MNSEVLFELSCLDQHLRPIMLQQQEQAPLPASIVSNM